MPVDLNKGKCIIMFCFWALRKFEEGVLQDDNYTCVLNGHNFILKSLNGLSGVPPKNAVIDPNEYEPKQKA